MGVRRPARTLPRRRTDRIEDLVAVVLCALGLTALVAAVVLGVLADGAVTARAAREAAERVRVEAVVAGPAAAPAPGEGSRPGTRPVAVDWTGPAGTPGHAVISVPVAVLPGERVPVWVDRAGNLVPPPTAPRAGLLVGAVAACWVGGAAVGALWMVWRLVRRWTAARNAAAWARGWAEVEPTWSGRAPAG